MLCKYNGVVRLHVSPPEEGAAKWLATGLENRGDGNVRGSIPPPSSINMSTYKICEVDRVVMSWIANPVFMSANLIPHSRFK